MNRVFQAVAEPTRRALLNRLRSEGTLSLGELAEPLDMSRQAATKHLKILEEAGLVTTWWCGRVKLHHLNAEPLGEVVDWLAPYSAAWDRRLEKLWSYLEGEND